jgi:exopolyphosphatase / guanosine-5'-triphosphate,3'-diphosphate pyrophosphatase
MNKNNNQNRVAIIDLGTNTLKLLIAEKDGKRWNYLLNMSLPCRLGEGLKSKKQLLPKAQKRTLEALSEAVSLCEELEVNQIYPIATEAFRLAENGEDFRQYIKQELALDFRILTGVEEASLAFDSLMNEFPASQHNSLIIDIGGGSTEISAKSEVRSANEDTEKESARYKGNVGVYGSKPISDNFALQNTESPSANFELRTSHFALLRSLPFGCVTLTEEFLHSDPPTRNELVALQMHIREIIGKLPIIAKPNSCFGIGGTIVTLGRISQGDLDSESLHGSTLRLSNIKNLSNIMNRLTVQQRKDLPGMVPGRADIMPAGTMVLIELMSYFQVNTLTISTRGIRHGYLNKLEC